MYKSSQLGRSMIEMIGVIGIISVVGTAIIKTVSTIFDRYKQSLITTQVRDLQKNIRTRYSAVGSYNELSVAAKLPDLIKDRVIPFGMVSDNKVYHSYNGPVKLAGSGATYTITFSDMTRGGCTDLLNLNWAVNDTSDLISLKAGGKTFSWTSTEEDTKLPIVGLTAWKFCDEDRAKNEIIWTFQ